MSLRRTFTLAAALAVAAAVLSGCSTAEGQRAQELLLAADAAQARLDSSSFEGGVSVAFGGQQVDVRFEGAGAGDEGYMSMRADGLPGAGSFAFDVVVRGGELWMGMDGAWQKLPAPSADPAALGSASLGPAAFAELARHVKAVRVAEGQLLENRAVTVVAGEVDTAGLLSSLTKLGGLADAAPEGFDLAELGATVGDIEAVLTIDEQTSLLTAALVTLDVTAGGETVELQLTYRLTSWNEPVTIPTPGA